MASPVRDSVLCSAVSVKLCTWFTYFRAYYTAYKLPVPFQPLQTSFIVRRAEDKLARTTQTLYLLLAVLGLIGHVIQKMSIGNKS